MKTLAVLPALLLLFDMASGGFVCDNPMPYVGTYKDQHRDRTQCTALVKLICPGLRNDTTHEWVSGEPVLPSCNIPQWTAIATFLGPGGNYNAPPRWNQHAAVFDSCEDGGIWVYDQNSSHAVKRTFFSDKGNVNSASNARKYYVIELRRR
ncbi:domesticated amidase effector 2-like [Amblyomma americanum]